MLVGTVIAAVLALRLPEPPLPPQEIPPPLGAPTDPVPDAPDAELDPAEALDEVWERIDAVRARGAVCGGRPLPPVARLKASAPLDVAAAGQATFMAESGVWDALTPGNPAGETPEARVKQAKFRGKLAREVLAWGQRTPADAVAWWLASTPHCEALMDPVPTHGGAAMVPDPESGGYVWVVVLARKR